MFGGGAGKEGTAVNSACERRELVLSKNGIRLSRSGPWGEEEKELELDCGEGDCLGRS